ncbi:hypothetical protein [Nonomuraea sp. NPDC049758]|uniref:hypothetical protein n=1 Tax=Nonomuraea sp. NPDC049758 TaxID=3154360 RepID=UPI00343667A8
MALAPVPEGTPDALSRRGDIVLTKVPGGLRVVKADEKAVIGLAVLVASCSHEATVQPALGGDLITIADQVVYRVTGYADGQLLVELVEDRRGTGVDG